MLQILFGGFIWTVRNYHTGGGLVEIKHYSAHKHLYYTLLSTHSYVLINMYIYIITEDE